MKYLCLVIVDEKKLYAMSERESQALEDESLAYDAVLREGGHLIAAQALQSFTTAATLRKRGGNLMVTDGPFAETREQVGGFILIEAKDRDEALQLASRIPAIRLGGVEVRPVKELVASSART